MPAILITGANSFVGSNYLKYSDNTLVDEISLIENEPKAIDFSKYDTVLHLAAIVHQSKKIPEREYYKINRDLTIEVAERAKKSGVKQFVFLSTVKVYGAFNPGSGPWNEKSECRPDDPYGRSKYAAEIELRKLEDGNFTVSVIRIPLVYGEGVRANMLSLMRLVDNFKILPFGKMNNKRSYAYVKNLVGFIDRIIEKRASGVFIAMDAEPLSTSDLVVLISKYLNKKRLLIHIPEFMVNIGRKLIPKIFERLYGSFEMENSMTLERLDFKPVYLTEEGIKEMVKSYIENKENTGKCGPG